MKLLQVLVTYKGQNIAVVTIESKWTPNKPVECVKVYGTSSLEHPAVQVWKCGEDWERVEEAERRKVER
eukprot:364367-Chlamydomonas_euryale.AAC.17